MDMMENQEEEEMDCPEHFSSCFSQEQFSLLILLRKLITGNMSLLNCQSGEKHQSDQHMCFVIRPPDLFSHRSHDFKSFAIYPISAPSLKSSLKCRFITSDNAVQLSLGR